MYCAIAVLFNAVTISSSFTLLHLDYIYNDYHSIGRSLQNLLLLKFSTAYLGYSVKYKFLCFLFLQQQKAGKRKNFVQREYVTVKGKLKGGDEP